MKVAFAILFAVHGAIHLIGFAKAFRLADIPQLHAAIGRPIGVLWLVAALAFAAAAILLYAWPERWCVVGAAAIVLSQSAILTAWPDAKFGSLANLAAVVPVALAVCDLLPSSFASTYRTKAEVVLAREAPARVVTNADLAPLPTLVQTYLRRAGVVGRPRVHSFRAEWRGQMKSGMNGSWMDMHAEQVNAFDHPTRLFYMTASRGGVPFAGLHVYEGTTATMRVRAASLFDVVDARGPEMDRSETVTLFNDMCLLAPASLLDADVTWRSIDERRIAAVFRNGAIAVSAELVFDDAGDLVNFISTDRDQSVDGKTFRRLPWSTPVRAYRDVDGHRVAAVADAMWSEPSGKWAYGHFELVALDYNPTVRPSAQARGVAFAGGLAR